MQHWQLRLIQALSVVGIVIAYYLYLFHDGQILPSCGQEGFLQKLLGSGMLNCYDVSGPTAAYSSIGPFSIATLGLLGYAAIFLLIWLSDLLPSLKEIVAKIIPVLVFVAFLFTGWLTWIEAVKIEAYCVYCLYSAAIVLVMFMLVLTMLFGRKKEKENPA